MNEKLDMIKNVLKNAAKEAGIAEYEIFYSNDENISTETLKDEISSFASGNSGGVSFRCKVNGKMGYASTELLEEEELKELVIRAVENAKTIENDDETFIFEGSEHYETISPKRYDGITAADLKETALKLQRETYACDPIVTDGTQSGALAVSSNQYICNSNGLELSNSVSVAVAYQSVTVNDGNEAVNDFLFAEGIKGEAVDRLPKCAVDSAKEKLGAGFVKSGKYSVIIDGKEMRSILSAFCPSFSGKYAILGLSRLKGKEGEKIASDCVTLFDDPMREGCPMQTSFDGEGVAAYKKNIIENGVLKTLLYDLSTAKKAGVTSTGNGLRGDYTSPVSIAPYSISFAPGERTLEELMKKVGNGIYVTELKGLHAGADAITGDFSIESAGFLIENGVKTKAVKTFTIAGNFFEMLKGIEEFSNEIEWGLPMSMTIFGSPAAFIANMSVAGSEE